MFISGVNQSMNRIYDIDDPIEKANSIQQLDPITNLATNVLNLETNPEVLDSIVNCASCSMESGARELERLYHNKSDKPFDVELLQYNQFVNSSGEVIEERSKQR